MMRPAIPGRIVRAVAGALFLEAVTSPRALPAAATFTCGD